MTSRTLNEVVRDAQVEIDSTHIGGRNGVGERLVQRIATSDLARLLAVAEAAEAYVERYGRPGTDDLDALRRAVRGTP